MSFGLRLGERFRLSVTQCNSVGAGAYIFGSRIPSFRMAVLDEGSPESTPITNEASDPDSLPTDIYIRDTCSHAVKTQCLRER